MLNTLLGRLKSNWKSGITVSLVSIPLSVSLAVASNASPIVGIITAIWAGLIASIFGGSNFNIVGPTGALSGILATYSIVHGADGLPSLAIVSGIFILAAFAFKLEKYLLFIPASVIHGFTLAVAFIIGLNQLNFALGLTGLKSHETFFENLIESLSHIGNASLFTFAIFLIFLALLFIIRKVLPKIPGAIILTPIGILLGYLSVSGILGIKLLTLGEKFQDLSFKLFEATTFNFSTEIIVPALTVALIAILETMISAKIADGMTKTKHSKRKEMLGLGLANIASGLAGGIPATAALARTSLNIKTGATHKISATISSVFVVVLSSIMFVYFRFIPLAVIAAILVFVAINMIELEHFRRLFKFDKLNFAFAMLVAVIAICTDPIEGILVGTVLSLLVFVDKLSRGQFELRVNDKKKNLVQHISGDEIKKINSESDTLVYSIKGQLAYINGQAHISRFESGLNGYKNVVIRLKELYFIDIDGVDALDEIIEIIENNVNKPKVLITGANEMIRNMLKMCEGFERLEKQGLVFDKTIDALNYLGYKLK